MPIDKRTNIQKEEMQSEIISIMKDGDFFMDESLEIEVIKKQQPPVNRLRGYQNSKLVSNVTASAAREAVLELIIE